MRALWAVYKRELGLFFRSTIAYAVAFALLGFMGLLVSSFIAQIVEANQSGFTQRFFTADDLIAAYMNYFTFLMVLFGPLLTMRLLAEESREGTLEVLMTLPLPDWMFVVGKWLAAWTVYTFILALTLIYVVLAAALGVPSGGLVLAIYLGAFLYGGAVLAVAMIWSALTEDQLVAAFLGAASILVLTLGSVIAEALGNPTEPGFANIIRELSLATHYNDTMLSGLVQLHDVIYFIMVTVVALFLTTLIVGTRRWRAA